MSNRGLLLALAIFFKQPTLIVYKQTALTIFVIHAVHITAEGDFFQVFVITKVNNNVGLFSMVKELWVFLNCRKRHPANRAAQITLRDLETAGTRTAGRSCKSQLALSTTERQRELRPVVAFPKNCVKLRKFHEVVSNLHSKFIRSYACLLHCSIYFQ
jgi:hypothetical protein